MTRPTKIVNGVLQYVSPSGINTANPNEYGGCFRAWFYKYVQGIKEPETAPQAFGKKIVHKPIETYLNGGAKVFHPAVLVGAHFIPAPSSYLGVEVNIHDDPSYIALAGVPVLGYIDLVNWGTYYISADADELPMAPARVEIVDWKSTSAFEYKGVSKLKPPDTFQLCTYGVWALRKVGGEHIRQGHVYFKSKTRYESRKLTRLLTREHVERVFESRAGVVRSLIDVAKESNPDKVPACTDSCDAYRGCYYRGRCSAAGYKSLEQIFGGVGAMSILNDIKTGNGVVTAATQPAQQPVVVAGAPQVVLPAPVVQAPPVDVTAFQTAWQAIMLTQEVNGWPTLTGEASQAYGKVSGTCHAGLAGKGWLAQCTLSTVNEVVQLAQELAAKAAAEATQTPAAAIAAIVPPETPASDPAQATSTQPAEEFQVAIDLPQRLNKDVRAWVAKAQSEIISLRNAGAIGSVLVAEAVATTAPAGAQVFVDCVPGGDFTSLLPYVDAICSQLAKQVGAMDIRCAANDTPLAYGKWKGALAAAIRECAPDPGVYMLDTRGSEIGEVVAEALATMPGVVAARGIR